MKLQVLAGALALGLGASALAPATARADDRDQGRSYHSYRSDRSYRSYHSDGHYHSNRSYHSGSYHSGSYHAYRPYRYNSYSYRPAYGGYGYYGAYHYDAYPYGGYYGIVRAVRLWCARRRVPVVRVSRLPSPAERERGRTTFRSLAGLLTSSWRRRRGRGLGRPPFLNRETCLSRETLTPRGSAAYAARA